MARWLRSGLRRDACIVLAGEDGLTAQQLKTRIEDHYDERLDPRSFRQALDALERNGHVETEQDGLADAYHLTDAGESMLRQQFEWMRDRVE